MINYPFVRFSIADEKQCDQLVILLIQYLAIYSNEHLPKTIKMAKVGLNFAKYDRNTPKIAKVAKFHQIWSHC